MFVLSGFLSYLCLLLYFIPTVILVYIDILVIFPICGFLFIRKFFLFKLIGIIIIVAAVLATLGLFGATIWIVIDSIKKSLT